MTLPFFSDKPRIRTILQSEAQECGLAALAMIANAYGHNVDLPYMRSVHQIYKGGMSLAELYTLAASFSLDARGLSIKNTTELAALKLPAILHWEGRHYVVLESIKRGKYVIHDPAVGRRTYRQVDLDKHFSGIALELTPQMSVEKIVSNNGLKLWDIVKSSDGFHDAFWKILVITLAVGILTLATPILLQVSLDFVLPQADVDLLGILTIGLMALLLFENIGRWLRDMVILRTSIGMQIQFTRSVVSHGLRLPLHYFEARHPGDLITRLESVDHVKAFAADGMVRSFADALMSIISVALMFYYSTTLTLMVLATLVVAIGFRMLYLDKTRIYTSDSLAAKTEQVSTLLDGLDQITALKAHNVSARYEQRWFEKLAKFASQDFMARKVQIDAQLWVHSAVVLGTIATLYAGVAAVLTSDMTIGMLYAFFALRSAFFMTADTLTTNLMHLTVIGAHVRRLEDVIQQTPEAKAKTGIIKKAIRRDIEIQNVAISFGNESRPIVANASFRISVERNERIAIVGESGSGKSSLLKVIASLAEPTEGTVLVDGQPLSRFGIMEYRANMGAVFAGDGLLQATLAENVSLFDPDISVDQIYGALTLVGLADEVEALPQGLGTQISNGNSLLSTGQRRRVLAARAICRYPRIMLFDEITANLDAETEHKLLQKLCQLPGAKIFVTHSDRLLDYVDRAYRLENGILSPLEKQTKIIEPLQPAAEPTQETITNIQAFQPAANNDDQVHETPLDRHEPSVTGMRMGLLRNRNRAGAA
jgi:ATP-binding cassette, subfamily B, bacterial CvaB/MchF/RaxB